MNRSTIIALVAFAVLLAVVLVIRNLPEEKEEKGFALPGWTAENAAELEEKEGEEAEPAIPGAPPKTAEAIAPVDRVEIRRGGETIVLERLGDAGDDRKKWKMTAPIEAHADFYRVRPILDAFQEPVESLHAKSVRPEDLRVFQLDEDDRISVKLSKKGEVVVDLIVGRAEKPDAAEDSTDPGKADTWVFKPGDETLAYRMPGVDLRTPVDKPSGELRSKKVLQQDKETVTRVVIENPDDKRYPRIVLVRDTPAADEGDDAPKKAATWRFETPKGFEPGNVGTFLSSTLGLYATEFLPADDAEGLAALAKEPARVALDTSDGSVVLHVSQAGEKHGYVRVEGRDEIVKVSQYSAKNLRKTLSDLRDKKVFRFSTEAVTAVQLTSKKGELALRLVDGTWTAEKPAGLGLSQKAVDRLLRDITTLSVTEFVGAKPPAETGLDAPARRVRVEAAGGVHTLLFGKKEDNKVFGTAEGSGEVFLVSSYNAEKFDKAPDDLRDKALFAFDKDAITRVELVSPGEAGPIVLERKDDGWTVAVGDKSQAAKKATADAVARTFATLEAKKIVAGKKPGDVGLGGEVFRAIAQLADGSRHTLWVSEEKDGTEVYVRTDTAKWADQVLTISEYQGKSLKKKLAELKEE